MGSRNGDRYNRSARDEMTNLVKFWDGYKNRLTKFEAFDVLLSGNYVFAEDKFGTLHRVSLDGHTEIEVVAESSKDWG